MEDEEKTIGTAPSTTEAEQLARTFAIAVRNVSVYPIEHPRSQAAAEECLELVRRRRGIVLTVYDRDLDCNGLRLASEAHLAWLIERIRNATLRGVVVSPHCTGDDLLQFARSLVAARQGGTDNRAFSWPDDHPRLRALPLVFTGTFGGTHRIGPETTSPVNPQGQEDAQAGAGSDGPPGVPGGSEDRSVTVPMASIENNVLDLIAEVVDDSAREALTEALADRVIDSIAGKTVDDGTLADTSVLDKLRLSANIAQRYFGRSDATVAVTDQKPAGRAEDAGIEADLDQLLAEIRALPEAANPAADPEQMASCAPDAIAQQLIGIYLYLFAAVPEEEMRAKLAIPMRRALAELAGNTSPIIDVYLGGGDFRALAENSERLALLDLLGQADKYDLIRESDYLDAKLVVASFPDSMPLAVRVLRTTPKGLEVLKQAVDTLVKQHGARKLVDMMRGKALLDPQVVRTFIDIGGDCADAVLTAVAWGGRLELYSVLVEHLEKQDLPAAERKALAALRPKDQGATSYLQQLLKEASTSVTKSLRLRSGELLRRSVQQARSETDSERLIAAIEDLALVPDDRTRELLRELGSRAGWAALFKRQSPTRAKALEVLKTMEGRRS